ncbi:MAG: hypothetical protein E7575_08020 [Ruminococcaceae bacterium]|nr:hypothetical protein [Oscillospiraceae bacterium]
MKKFLLGFIIACISILLIPLVVMAFRPTNESTDNRRLAEFPSVVDADGGPNLAFFTGFESWFKDHFAFRNELIYADAKIQNDIFKVSNVDNVISGKDGWLFYTSTLKDYLGTDRLSDREIYNIAHNISIAYDYVKGKGSNFILTVPANKNTLYGEYMPYYDSLKVDTTQNTDVLAPLLEAKGIPYADLIKGFKEEDEVLYLKTDSHWSNKGAVLAYNIIMDGLGLAHDDYSQAQVTGIVGEGGDLSKMMYTFYGDKEDNPVYAIEQNYEYQGNFKSVEDGRIETKGTGENGRLLMFRDSFGNTLVPLIANEFGECFFTRENLYSLERYVEEKKPDTVIFEKVQRNIEEFITMPPIISAPVYEGAALDGPEFEDKKVADDSQVSVKPLEAAANYYEISGTVSRDMLETETEILVNVNGVTYRAYHTGEDTFCVYIKKDVLSLPADIKVFAV